MADRIQVTPRELYMHASELKSCVSDLSNNCARIDRVLHSVYSAWSGDAISKLISEAEHDVRFCEKLSRDLEELARVIEKVANTYEEAESSIAAKFMF